MQHKSACEDLLAENLRDEQMLSYGEDITSTQLAAFFPGYSAGWVNQHLIYTSHGVRENHDDHHL
jgi:hypothetical protein